MVHRNVWVNAFSGDVLFWGKIKEWLTGIHFLIVPLDGSDKKLSRAIEGPAHSALKAI